MYFFKHNDRFYNLNHVVSFQETKKRVDHPRAPANPALVFQPIRQPKFHEERTVTVWLFGPEKLVLGEAEASDFVALVETASPGFVPGQPVQLESSGDVPE